MKALRDVVRWFERAPEALTFSGSDVVAMLAPVLDAEGEPVEVPAPVAVEVEGWDQRLWSCHADTVLGVTELAEAINKSESWVYRRTMTSNPYPIPHSKMGGRVVFRAGEVRPWFRKMLDDRAVGIRVAG